MASAHIVAAAGGKIDLLKSGSLSTTLDSLTVAGVGAVAYGELISSSAGAEYAVAGGPVLTIYANDLSTVLATRDFTSDNVTEILSLSIGECRADLPGNELAVGTKPGFIFVLNPESGTLAQVNGTSAGTQVSAVAIADVNTANAGGEVIFTWEYTTGEEQIAVFGPKTDTSFNTLKIWSVVGVCQNAIQVGDTNNDGNNEFVVALSNGDVYHCSANILVVGNAISLYFIGSAGVPPRSGLRCPGRG